MYHIDNFTSCWMTIIILKEKTKNHAKNRKNRVSTHCPRNYIAMIRYCCS